jgi:hypothetical protein
MNYLKSILNVYEKLSHLVLDRFPTTEQCLVRVMDVAVPPLEVMFVQTELTHELSIFCERNNSRNSPSS